MMRRRSKLSASAPETSENIMIGSVVEAWTSATMSTEDESEVISQAAPTACTSPPKFEARLAIQIVRNISCRNGASGDDATALPLLVLCQPTPVAPVRISKRIGLRREHRTGATGGNHDLRG